MKLEQLGFGPVFSRAFDALGLDNAFPGRVVWQGVRSYRVLSERGEFQAVVTGKLGATGLPAVGDWVALYLPEDAAPGTIAAVLPRGSVFSRKAVGKAVSEQVVASNIDEVFIVTDLDRDLNFRRIERYITMVYNSGALPVVVLNKSDLSRDPSQTVHRVCEVSPGVPVYAVSAATGLGLDQLLRHATAGRTVAFLGSSGVGKSSLINRLLGRAIQEVGAVRAGDGKGRHTTASRELHLLPGGGAVIDTPGMREIQVWGDEGGLADTFPEIEDLSAGCRFGNCRHESERDCAVIEALEAGTLDQGRYESYRKLRAEFENLRSRRSQRARWEERRAGRRFAKMVREVDRFHPKRRKP